MIPPGLSEWASIAGLKIKQSRLDVLAGAKTADAKVYASAGKEPMQEAPDFYVIGYSASRANAEIREDGMPVIKARNLGRFSVRAQSPLVNFVSVRRAPIMGMGNRNFKTSSGNRPVVHQL
jgi:hypothetical protein